MISKEYVNSLPIEEKIAHMIIVRGESYPDRIKEMAQEGQLGGMGAVALPKESRTLEGVAEFMNDLREKSDIPLFFYIDAEWGMAQIFKFATRFPPLMAIGATGEQGEELSMLHGQVIGREAKALGFHIVANPPLDVNIEPKNPIICTRAFSDDADKVIKLGRAYLKGMQGEGVICCGKHYPGHGATAVDSHISMPEVTRTREELMDVELRPYKELADEMWGVMTAHIHFPALAGEGEEGVPATLSRTMLYDLLRGELGYDNLIVSDSLTMKGIKDKWGLEAAIGAINAGHDLILQDYSTDPKITYDLVLDAAKSGKIPMDWINESVYRVLKFKEKVGCMGNPCINAEEIKKVVGCDEHVAAARRIARASVTMIEGADIALDAKGTGKTLIITTIGPEEESGITDIGDAGGRASVFTGDIVNTYCKADLKRIPEVPSAECVDELIELAKGYDTVLMASFVRTVSYKENSGQMDAQLMRLIKELEASSATFAPMFFGNPYVIAELPKFRNCLLAYGDDRYSVEAVVAAVFGEFEPTGKLPVNVDERYPRCYSYGK